MAFEDWAFYRNLGIPVDETRWALIQTECRLVRPSSEHAEPGNVKVSDGAQEYYLQSLTGPCERDGCRVYLWDDDATTDFWLQHGDNPEAVGRFPRRFFLEVAFPLSAERPDPFAWVTDCHRYLEAAA